jgi:hypothetical protein
VTHPAETDGGTPASPAVRVPDEARLVIATHNPGKLDEMRDLLAPYGVGAVFASPPGAVGGS